MIYIGLAVLFLGGCNYKPPYQRGYDEGYAAGYAASDGEVSEDAPTSDASVKGTEAKSVLTVRSDKADEADKAESADDDSRPEEDNIADEADDTGDDGDDEAYAESGNDDSSPDVTEDADADEGSGADVLGEELEPADSGESSGSSGIPAGRIITADAVNEALYSHPEVIDGLREIYADTAIFGEYVGDSENNLLHKTGSSHFAELGYDTIVVFDDSKSLQDILNEGFYTRCDCID